MNLNDLARTVTLKEGKKKSVSIAQIKEVMKILLTELAQLDFNYEVEIILRRYRGKSNKK